MTLQKPIQQNDGERYPSNLHHLQSILDDESYAVRPYSKGGLALKS